MGYYHNRRCTVVFLVAAIVFPRSACPYIKGKYTEVIQNNNNKNVLQFTVRRRKRKTSKAIFWKARLVYPRAGDSMHPLVESTKWLTQPKGKWKCFLVWLCYKRNGKRCSCATIELLMSLEDLLSTQEARVNSYASFALSNLPRTSHNSMVAHCTFTIS